MWTNQRQSYKQFADDKMATALLILLFVLVLLPSFESYEQIEIKFDPYGDITIFTDFDIGKFDGSDVSISVDYRPNSHSLDHRPLRSVPPISQCPWAWAGHRYGEAGEGSYKTGGVKFFLPL